MSSDIDNAGDPHGPLPEPLPTAPDAPSTRSGRSRLVAPLATVAAVAVVVAGAGLFFTGDSGTGSQTPPVLHLVDRSANLAVTAAEGVRDRPAVGFTGARLEVSGTLPDRPDHASVRVFGTDSAPRDRVAALAEALGVSGLPEHHGDRWQVRSGDRLLTVSDLPGWPWDLTTPLSVVSLPPVVHATAQPAPGEDPTTEPSPVRPPAADPQPLPGQTVPTMSCMAIIDGHRACPEGTPVIRQGGTSAPGAGIPEEPDRTTTTGGATGSGSAGSAGGSTGSGPATPVPTPPGPIPIPATPEAGAVRAAAAPVLAALGLDHARLTVTTSPGRGQVTADPVVGGLPTSGLSTVLGFDDSAHLGFGAGWLAAPRSGARYPLASARAVLDARPTPMCDACPRSDTPTTVTGARLGLALNWNDRGGPLLVPAWFYDLRGSEQPLVLVAVDSRFLGAPRSPGTQPDSGVGGPGVGGPGVSEPGVGQPGVVEPVPGVVEVRPPASPAPRATH